MKAEGSTLSSRFLALKSAIEATKYLLFKLRSFGIQMVYLHATNVYSDNQSVLNNTAIVE